ncbi:hypothetical protein VIGAN_03087900, partial [Vigna angularis var. angularis]
CRQREATSPTPYTYLCGRSNYFLSFIHIVLTNLLMLLHLCFTLLLMHVPCNSGRCTLLSAVFQYLLSGNS